MSIPEAKRFPIVFEMATDDTAASLAESAPIVMEHPVEAVAHKHGWKTISGEGRWVIEADENRRVQVIRSQASGGGVLRFVNNVRVGSVSREEQAVLLRKNARMAHAGFAVVPGSGGGSVALVSTLLEDTADEEEIDSVLRSLLAGGEWVVAKSIDSFDHTAYKLPPPPPTLGTWEEEVLRQALEGTEISWQCTGPRAAVVVRLPGDRRQTVHVLFDRADSTGNQVIQFISMCGPAKPEHFPMALASNATLSLASVAVGATGSNESLLVVRTQLGCTADREEVLASITTVARIADQIENQVTGGEDRQ